MNQDRVVVFFTINHAPATYMMMMMMMMMKVGQGQGTCSHLADNRLPRGSPRCRLCLLRETQLKGLVLGLLDLAAFLHRGQSSAKQAIWDDLHVQDVLLFFVRQDKPSGPLL